MDHRDTSRENGIPPKEDAPVKEDDRQRSQGSILPKREPWDPLRSENPFDEAPWWG